MAPNVRAAVGKSRCLSSTLFIGAPLGNADPEYWPRTLEALKNFDLDQVIILTHDEEVTPRLAETIRTATLQTFLVTFEGAAKGSTVQADAFFGR